MWITLSLAFMARNVKTIPSHFPCLLTVGGRRPLTASCRSEWKLVASLIQQLFPSLSSSTGLISIVILALKFTSQSSVSKVELELLLFGCATLLGLVLDAVAGHRWYCITASPRFSLAPKRDLLLECPKVTLLVIRISCFRSGMFRIGYRALILPFCHF